MILEVVLIFMLFGMITFLKSIENQSVMISGISLFTFIILLASSMYIQVPGATDTYQDLTVNIFSLGMIFLNIVWMVIVLSGQAVDRRFRL